MEGDTSKENKLSAPQRHPEGDNMPASSSPLKRPIDLSDSDHTPLNSPLKRSATDPFSTPSPKRCRVDSHRTGGKWGPAQGTPEANGTPKTTGGPSVSTGGKNGPRYPLPVLEDSPRERPRLFIPKTNSADDLRTPDGESSQILVRLDSATPNKPLFIDNDPSMGVDFPLAVNSPVPFPPSRQNSCNSLVRFSEKLFEDNQPPSDDSLSLPDINDRAFTLGRSPSSLSVDSDSSGIQMRQIPTPASESSHCSDGFVVNPETDSGTKETEISEKTVDSPSRLSDAQELENSCDSEPTQILDEDLGQSGKFAVSELVLGCEPAPSSATLSVNNYCTGSLPSSNNEAVPSTSKSNYDMTRTKSERDTDLMFHQVQLLVDRLSSEGVDVDPNDVFLTLERYRIAENRLEIVYEELVQRNLESKFQIELEELQAQFYDVDFEILRTLMENHRNTSDRKLAVISDLKANASLVHDAVFVDVLHLSKIFPDRDRMEIYAYLKAKQHEPKRVDLVAELLLQSRQETMKTNDPLEVGDSQLEFVAEVESLQNIFPDADRDYLFEQLKLRRDDPKRKENLASRMAELRTYTKINERPKKGKKRKMKFILKDFVKTFPNALEFFNDYTRLVNDSYKRHSRVYLLNYFTSITAGFIDETLRRHNGHLTPTFKSIRDCVDRLSRDAGNGEAVHVFAEEPRTRVLAYPDLMDELFAKELQFLEHEGEILNYITLLAKEKQRAKDSARASGDLMECQCCYDDEVLFEEMQACEEGHPFCIQCIRMSAETAIGEGKSKFDCLSENCESQFPLTVLKQILRPEVLAKVIQRVQDEEIRLAGIENLVSCPFCPFATIMDDERDKVFRCQNPECLKESCRFCSEINHLPLTCEEVVKDCTDMRTFVERRVSEAMIRVCQSCSKRFYKNDGCNKMTCACGASMCYVCRAPDIGYEHFGEGGDLCNLYEDSAALHKNEMEAAGRKACEEYVRLHPEAAGKFDHEELIRDVPSRGGRNHGGGEDYDDDDEEDMDEEDEDEMDYDEHDDEREYEDDDYYRRA